MTDFLDEKRREISARLKELKPLVDEYHRLEAASAALDGVSASAAATPPPKRARRAKPSPATGTRRRGRPPGGGQRTQETLTLVSANPGITIPELAEKMGIKQNYLYRVLPRLSRDGLVHKQGRGWHARDAA